MVTVADHQPTSSAVEQDQKTPGATDTVTETTVEQDSAASPNTTQGQELSSPTEAVTDTAASQQPRKYVFTKGEDIFQSLFAGEKTPPTSPGSVASSNTLVDPSSRKVSPTAVKDFAYPPSDSNHVLDPVALIEENTKKELLKQLRKKTAAEEKASKKAMKLTARNQFLSAELKSAKANVQNREAQAELAKTQANAMTVSNIVLRQVVQDLCRELSCKQDVGGAKENGVGFFDKYDLDPATLSSIFGSVTPTVQERSEKKAANEGSHVEDALTDDETDDETEEERIENGTSPALETADQVKDEPEETTKQAESNVEWILPSLKPKEFVVGNGQAMEDLIATDLEDATPDRDNLSESSGEDQEQEADDENFPQVVDESLPGTDCDEEDLAVQETTPDAIQNEDRSQGVVIGHEGAINGNFEFSEPAGPATLWGILQSNQGKTGVEAREGASDKEVNVSEPETPGLATLPGILESEQVKGEAVVNEAVANEEETDISGVGNQKQDDAELIGLSHEGSSPDINGDSNDTYDASGNEEEVMEPPTETTAAPVKGNSAPSPSGSVDGDKVAVQVLGTQQVAVEEAVEVRGADSLDDLVEAITEPLGGLKPVEEDDHDAEDAAVEAIHLQEITLSVVKNTPTSAVEALNGKDGNATVAREADQGEQQANAYESSAIGRQLEDDCEKEGLLLADDDAIVSAWPMQVSAEEQKEDPEEAGETLEEPAASGHLIVAEEEDSVTTSEEGNANSGVIHAQPLTPPETPSQSARAFSPLQVEKFDVILPMPTPKEISKTEKRKLERRRAAARKADEAAVKRWMEEEAAKTAEGLALRQAEEDKKVGEKRLRLQAARMQEG